MITAPLRVTVQGLAHSGKTVILSVLEKALREVGFSNVQFINPEEPMQHRGQLVDGLANKTHPDFFKKMIMLEEVTAGSESRAQLRSLTDDLVLVPRKLSPTMIQQLLQEQHIPFLIQETEPGSNTWSVIQPNEDVDDITERVTDFKLMSSWKTFEDAELALELHSVKLAWERFLAAVEGEPAPATKVANAT